MASRLFLSPLLLLLFLVDTSTQEVTVINITEGDPAGMVLIDLSHRIESNRHRINTEVDDRVYRSVFNNHFTSDDRGVVTTRRTVERDTMAGELGMQHSPVEFNIMLTVFRFIVPIDRVNYTLRVLDIDDHNPTFVGFETSAFNVSISEGESDSNYISIPLAQDNDEGTNAVQNYSLTATFDGLFGLDVRRIANGLISEVRLTQEGPLDREERSNYILDITAVEGSANPQMDTLTVNITVLDICDTAPMFPVSMYYASIHETTEPIGRTVILSNITAMDDDLLDIGNLRYEISSNNPVCAYIFEDDSTCDHLTSHPFHLDMETGNLIIEGNIDREEYAKYDVNINAVDSCSSRDSATVEVTILNINDNAPELTIEHGAPEVIENADLSNIYFLNLRDRDYGNTRPQYSITLHDNSSGTPMDTDLFRLARDNTSFPPPGQDALVVSLTRSLDREEASQYQLVINATDWGSPNISFLLRLTITVLDVNDNAPIFESESIPVNYTFDENQPVNEPLITVLARDRDSGGNGNVTYLLPPANTSFPFQDLFTVNQMGQLIVSRELDREQQDFLSILVEARDNPTNGDPKSDFLILNIRLRDVNDNTPTILTPPDAITISEAQPTGTEVFTVTAFDNDTEPFSSLTFSLTVSGGNPFSINTMNGSVFLITSLDHDTVPSYSLTVSASDGTRTGTRTVTVMVGDVNDERCVFDTPSQYMEVVREDQPPDFRVININATDRDTLASELVFDIVTGNDAGHFRIDQASGEIFTTVSLDKEMIDNYTLTVSCSDGSDSPTNTSIFLQVADINDNIPEFINLPYNFMVSEGNPEGTRVGVIRATDLDTSSNGVIRYNITGVTPDTVAEGWFHLDEQSGEITTTRILDRETPGLENSRVILHVDALDTPTNGTPLFDNAVVNITITDRNDEPPVFDSPSRTFNLPENFAIGQEFATIHAVDNDIYPNNLTRYEISQRSPPDTFDQFMIDETTGVLRLITTLDYETHQGHEFQILASDTAFQAVQDVIIIVGNVPETNITLINFVTSVDLYENTPIGHVVTTFVVSDNNGTPLLRNVENLVCTISNTDGTMGAEFGISRNISTSEISIYVTGEIDREALVARSAGSNGMVEVELNITVRDPDTTEQTHGSTSGILRVTILDENDNPPIFDRTAYSFNITENNDIALPLGPIRARDIDFGTNGTSGITYSTSGSVPFQVNSAGELRSTVSLDREANASYTFTVTASDGGPTPMTSSVPVHVMVFDVNDNPPVFDPNQNRSFPVREDTSVGTTIATLNVYDLDAGQFGNVVVAMGSISSRNFNVLENGSIVLIQSLDREQEVSCFFTVEAMDGGGQRTTADVNIIVEDFNDNAPVFEPNTGTFRIMENHPPGIGFASVRAVDIDAGYNSIVRYAIGNYSLSSTFHIDAASGEISLLSQDRGCLDRELFNVTDFERRSEYLVNIVAYDLGIPRHIVSKTIRIIVLPVNEHPPIFDRGHVTVFVNETLGTNFVVAHIRAVDGDSDDTNLNYQVLEDGATSLLFHYERSQEAILSNGVLDYNTRNFYDLTLQARDSGDRIGIIHVQVVVLNINNHAPVFEPGSDPNTLSSRQVVVSESMPVSTVIWRVRATDEDNATHDAVSYFLEAQPPDFSIDSLTGEIYINSTLDYERTTSYQLHVTAKDTGNPQMTSTPISFQVSIRNENDEDPVFDSPTYEFSIAENEPNGTFVGRVHASDRDTGDFSIVRYSILNGINDYFRVDNENGSIFTRVVLDRDTMTEGVITFEVLATDYAASGSAARTDRVTVSITVLDLNDNKPVLDRAEYLVRIAPDQAPNSPLDVTISATDIDGETNNRFHYALQPSSPDAVPLTLTPLGQLQLNQAVPSNYQPSYHYTVTATDVQDSSLFSTARLELIIETENDHHPQFNPDPPVVRLREDMPEGAEVFQVRNVVADEDTGTNGDLSYAFGGNYVNFNIDGESGEISLRQMVDFEGTKNYTLIVLAMDGREGTRRTATGTVLVNVEPYNEDLPEFTQIPTQITLSHLPEIGLELFTVAATDRDEGEDGTVRYSIYDSNFYLSINSTDGVVRNQGILTEDRTFSAIIGAYDLGNPPLGTANATVQVTIRDAGSMDTPTFSAPHLRTVMVAENVAVGSFISSALTTNPPASSFHIVKQTISGQTTPTNIFSINAANGRLQTLTSLDYEQNSRYEIVIESRRDISPNNRASDFLWLTVMVTDVNDNQPTFLVDVGDLTFSESTPVNTLLFEVQATDDDSGQEGTIEYDIFQGDSQGTFRINHTTGEVYLNQPLDRETVSTYDLLIRAFDLSNEPQSSEMSVHIEVMDVNDFEPTFGNRNFTLGVYEYPETQGGDRIILLSATDEDEGRLRYTMDLVEASYLEMPVDISNLRGTFNINPDSGLISLESQMTLDRESVDSYVLHVMADDRQTVAETYLTITVEDVNDHSPQIHAPDSVDVLEAQPIGLLVTDGITVTDRDTGVNAWVRYSLGEGWPENYFVIDPLSGVIRINDVIVARDSIDTFRGVVNVEDHGIVRRTSSAMIQVNILDVNDHPPLFIEDGSIVDSITLEVSEDEGMGYPIHTFHVTDADFLINNSPVMYYIPGYYIEVQDLFSIQPSSGVLTLRKSPTGVRSYNFVLQVRNTAYYPECVEFMQASSINVTVLIRPQNRGCPVFTHSEYSTELAEEMSFSSGVLTVLAEDPDGDMVTYSLSNREAHPFNVDPTTGVITLVGMLDREVEDNYVFAVVATDRGLPIRSCSANISVSVLDINDNQPVFQNRPYTGRIDENSGPDSFLLRVNATDRDLDANGGVMYNFTQPNPLFRIDASTGMIFTVESLDFEATPTGNYTLEVVASDGGAPSLSSSAIVTIVVNNINEGGPQIAAAPREIEIPEGIGKGIVVYTVNASDVDRGTVLVFSFTESSCYFSINSMTGEIVLKVSPGDEITCSEQPPLTSSSSNPDYFIVKVVVNVTDGKLFTTMPLNFSLHSSFRVSTQPAPVFPVEIIGASITGVLAIILIFVCIFVFACVCRARRNSKIRINDRVQSVELQKRFGSERSNKGMPLPTYRQTSLGSLPPEHTINHTAGGSGASSTRQSYVCTGDTEQSYPSPILKKSQLSKPYRSTSDLGSSTMATDMLSGESQEAAPYPKAQIDKIYAKNADLLNHSDSESMHMFGSEGGGESDGGDDMLFAKFTDLDDDDDSTTMQDDERSYQETSLSNSRENGLNIAPPVEMDMGEDPYPFDHMTGMKWAPQINDMADTINQMVLSDYETDRRGVAPGGAGPAHYMVDNGFSKSQEGLPMYGGLTQESTRGLPRQQLPPPHSQPRLPHYYYDPGEVPEDVHLHSEHRMPKGTGPKYMAAAPSTGIPMYHHDIPRGMPRHVSSASQEAPPPMHYGGYSGDFMHHHVMPHEMGGNHSSSSTPTEGTLTTRALTNEYDESDVIYSSDTSINTNTESEPPHPHLRGPFSQSNHSQRHYH